MKLFNVIAAASAFGLFAAVLQPAKSQSLPKLRQGMKIPAASMALQNSGWQIKYAYPWCNDTTNSLKSEICRSHSNVIECSANGYCAYEWVNQDGQVLSLTAHEHHPQGLVNWRMD